MNEKAAGSFQVGRGIAEHPWACKICKCPFLSMQTLGSIDVHRKNNENAYL